MSLPPLMDPALRAFGDLLSGPDADLDLGVGALLIARVEHPDIEVHVQLKRLDELAGRSGAPRIADPVKALHRLREFLFEEEGFRGNAHDYYDPLNSCLNDVLDRKLGIPISLSVVMMEVGRRAGVPIVGIGLPGHFVVSARVGGERLILDPFDKGALLTPESAAVIASRVLGREVRLTENHFAAMTKRQILIRMLLNLKAIYMRTEQWAKGLAVIDRLLLLDVTCATHRRDRGTALVKLGHLFGGIADWEQYLRGCPEAEDAPSIRHHLRQVRERLAALN